MRGTAVLGTVVGAAVALVAAGCGTPGSPQAAGNAALSVVAAENQYGDVVAQVGGGYVRVFSVESNPNTDPHTYEATPAVARRVATADLLVENGLGYDGFLDKLAAASPNPRRRTVDAARLLGLPGGTRNPHLWYDPATMPAVAKAVAGDLAALAPAHAAVFRRNEARFVASLRPWRQAIAAFKAAHPAATAAAAEPVADDLLQAMGVEVLTPFTFQADVMNGTDPTPQGVARQDSLLAGRRVRFFAYNQQVVDAVTRSLLATALHAKVPVVGFYETMPTPGYDYQSWMMAEVAAVQKAVADGRSTLRL